MTGTPSNNSTAFIFFKKGGKKIAVNEANKQKRITALIGMGIPLKRKNKAKKVFCWAAEKKRAALPVLVALPLQRQFAPRRCQRRLPGVTEATASGTKADVLKTTSPRARGSRGRMPGDCDTGTLVALAGTAAAAR